MSKEYSPLLPERYSGLYPSSAGNTFVRGVTFSALAIEPLYSAFLWQSARDAAAEALRIFGVAVTDQIRDYIQWIAVPFAVANLACDLTSLDPFSEADELTATGQTQSQRRDLSKKLLGFFIKLLAVVVSYPAGASADAIPIAGWVSQWLSGTPALAVNYTSLAIVTILGVVFYSMFTNARIDKHANEIIDTLKNLPGFGKRFVKNFGAYLEILIQIIGNSFYRGVGFAYIWGEACKEVFNAAKEGEFNKTSSMITGVTTFIVTLLSRTLSTRDKFLPASFDTLTPQDILRAPKIWGGYAFDLLLSTARGASAGYILYEELKPHRLPVMGYETYRYLRLIGCTLLGLVLLTHSAYVRYQAGRKQLALGIKKSLGGGSTKQAAGKYSSIERAVQQFDEIAATYNSPGFNLMIDVFNTAARLLRLLAFLLFVETMNTVFFGGHFSGGVVIALTTLWGLEVFKNDGDVYRESIKATLQIDATKWKLQGERNPDNWAPTRAIKTFFTGKYSYSAQEINSLHQNTPGVPTVEEVKDAESNVGVINAGVPSYT